MTRMTLFMTLVSAALACPGLLGQQLPADSPEHAGFSQDALARIAPRIQKHIEENRITGATGLIARHGKVVYFETYGVMDRENSKPMPKDAIFRIYSMTKAVTGVAVMILHDQGKFSLDDPVAKFLPEFASPKVAVEEKDSQTGKRSVRLVDAERAITVLDLLRHTSGINYLGPRDNDGESYYRTVDVRDAGVTLEEKMKRLARAPLVHQPGTTWDYGYSIDVLGRLVEVVSGLPLDRFFDTRILQPLGMVDTGFSVPESKWDRLVTLDTPGDDGTVHRAVGPAQEQFKKPATWFSGGGGLVGTTMDYARFCQMLLNEGELDGVRVLSQRAVRMMHSDHLGDLPHSGPLLASDAGFGLTFRISKTTGSQGTKGTYNWGGAAGTRFWIDPEKDLFGIFMVNILPHTGLHYGEEFKQLVYESPPPRPHGQGPSPPPPPGAKRRTARRPRPPPHPPPPPPVMSCGSPRSPCGRVAQLAEHCARVFAGPWGGGGSFLGETCDLDRAVDSSGWACSLGVLERHDDLVRAFLRVIRRLGVRWQDGKRDVELLEPCDPVLHHMFAKGFVDHVNQRLHVLHTLVELRETRIVNQRLTPDRPAERRPILRRIDDPQPEDSPFPGLVMEIGKVVRLLASSSLAELRVA